MRVRFAVLAVVLSACPPAEDQAPQAGALRVGVGTRSLNQPVGVPLGGYLRTRTSNDARSPWAKNLPASTGIHSTPTARAVVFDNGLTRVAMVRIDATLTSNTLHTRVVNAVAADVKVLISATHSHAAPARIMPPARVGGPTGDDFVGLVMDTYDAEVEKRTAAAIVGAIEDATAALAPASIGIATIDAADFNNDRRCENDPIYGPDFRDRAVTVIRVDAVGDDGTPTRPMTALIHYAMHGTVLGSDNTLQSTEAPGALELYSSDLLGVPTMYVQGAAGDVSPAGSPFNHGELQRLERNGRKQAELVKQAWERAAPPIAPKSMRLAFHERGVTVSREAIGYAKGEFPEGGGLQCGAGGDGACGEYVSMPSEVICLPLEKRPAFKTALSLVQLGDDLAFISLPGEPGTGLSRKIDAALAPLGATHALTVGYAQDHYGYLLEENDWMRGGYEPTVSAWGWKSGPYLLGEVEAFVASIGDVQPSADLVTDFPTEDAGVRAVTPATNAAHVVNEPIDGERLTQFTFVFEGEDPSLGTPQVALEHEENGTFVPVMASPTRPVVNGPELLLTYSASPTFLANPTAGTRVHQWTVNWETLPDTPMGTYRFVNGEMHSRAFEVTKSTALLVGAARVGSEVQLRVHFAPNPSVKDASGTVVGHYRVRDGDADPSLGVPAAVVGAVTANVDGQMVTFTAGPTRGVFSAQTTATALVVPPLTDRFGNTSVEATFSLP